jgi:hypothetical protein
MPTSGRGGCCSVEDDDDSSLNMEPRTPWFKEQSREREIRYRRKSPLPPRKDLTSNSRREPTSPRPSNNMDAFRFTSTRRHSILYEIIISRYGALDRYQFAMLGVYNGRS